MNFPFKHQTTATTTTSLKLNDLNNKLNDFVVKLDEIPTKVLQATATSTPPGELQDNGRGKKGCRCGNATPVPGKVKPEICFTEFCLTWFNPDFSAFHISA